MTEAIPAEGFAPEAPTAEPAALVELRQQFEASNQLDGTAPETKVN